MPYDPDMAEKLLDEAGYPRGADGVRFKIRLQGPKGRYLNDANVVQAIGQYLSDVGVQTEVELLEWASVYSPLLRTKKMGPLFFLGQGGVTWNPLYDMSLFSTPEAATTTRAGRIRAGSMTGSWRLPHPRSRKPGRSSIAC